MFIGGLNWETTDGKRLIKLLLSCKSWVSAAHFTDATYVTTPNDPLEGLSAYFSQFGVVKDCCIMRDPTGRSRGFAFLTFADASVIPDVLKRDHNVDGKIVSLTHQKNLPGANVNDLTATLF
jgi:RNA recognition motif-containing protein